MIIRILQSFVNGSINKDRCLVLLFNDISTFVGNLKAKPEVVLFHFSPGEQGSTLSQESKSESKRIVRPEFEITYYNVAVITPLLTLS